MREIMDGITYFWKFYCKTQFNLKYYQLMRSFYQMIFYFLYAIQLIGLITTFVLLVMRDSNNLFLIVLVVIVATAQFFDFVINISQNFIKLSILTENYINFAIDIKKLFLEIIKEKVEKRTLDINLKVYDTLDCFLEKNYFNLNLILISEKRIRRYKEIAENYSKDVAKDFDNMGKGE